MKDRPYQSKRKKFIESRWAALILPTHIFINIRVDGKSKVFYLLLSMSDQKTFVVCRYTVHVTACRH